MSARPFGARRRRRRGSKPNSCRPGRPLGSGQGAGGGSSGVRGHASSPLGAAERGSAPRGLLPSTIKPQRLRSLGAAVAAPGQLLPASSGHNRALPRMARLCPLPGVPAPHTPSPPLSAGCSLSPGNSRPLGPLGLTTCLHDFNVCNYGFCVGLYFLHFCPTLYFSHANTQQGTAAEKQTRCRNLFWEWLSSLKNDHLLFVS